jgi:Ca-activated chloride channel family protein
MSLPRLTIALLTSSLLATPVGGQNDGQGSPQTRSEQVVHVSVVADKRYVGDLGQSAFSALLDKKPTTVRLLRTTCPASVVVVLDVSTSMHISDRQQLIERIGAAASELNSSRNDETEFSFVAVADGVSQVSPFVRDPRGLFKGESSLPTPNSTAMFDSCRLAVEALRTQSTPKRVMIVVSDGQDNRSRTSYVAVRNLLLRDNVLVYTVLWSVGLARDTQSTQLYGAALLEELASQTGGLALEVTEARELDAVFRQIATDLNNQYSLGITVPGPIRKDGIDVRIEVELPKGRVGRNKAQVRCQKRVFDRLAPGAK